VHHQAYRKRWLLQAYRRFIDTNLKGETGRRNYRYLWKKAKHIILADNYRLESFYESNALN
jgi:IS1 family transposase